MVTEGISEIFLVVFVVVYFLINALKFTKMNCKTVFNINTVANKFRHCFTASERAKKFNQIPLL